VSAEQIIRKPEEEPQRVIIRAFRHGPTPWNTEGRIQGNIQNNIIPGRIEEYLTKIGATELERPDAFVVSKLARTRQTAEALIQLKGWMNMPILEDALLNEKRWGIFEGLTDAEARPRVIHEPELRQGFSDIHTLDDVARIWEHPDFKVPGGESSGEVRIRMEAGLSKIAHDWAGKNLIMISHAGALISLGLDHHIINTIKVINEKGKFRLESVSPLSPG
jgi:broad specificity phosphatase PhoE